ncbi:hypothetical protein PybrP1_000561 [[Pythium] brassicae (nom. inval.)]|nr:hypothetical protein PybrP1_000561 [[Pythium] brassicae (nom. inval.)]
MTDTTSSSASKWTARAKSRGRSASTPVLTPSLKKPQPASLAAKWGAYLDGALGRRDARAHALHNPKYARRSSGDGCSARHVRFQDGGEQEFERPPTTAAEKASYHYSQEELARMLRLAKQLAQCASRFDGLPEDTIVEQGFLTLPAHNVFFAHKSYYCLLERNHLLCYASPAHAAKRTGLKAHFSIIDVQDAQAMPAPKKLALFGPHLPEELPRMLVITKASGERVPVTAETKMAKRNWLHTLRKLTRVVEPAGSLSSAEEDADSPVGSPADKRHRGNSSAEAAAGATESTATRTALEAEAVAEPAEATVAESACSSALDSR